MTTAAIAAALLVMWHAMPSFAHLFGVYGLLLIVFCLSPLCSDGLTVLSVSLCLFAPGTGKR